MQAVRINVLGSLEIKGAVGAPRLSPGARIPRVTLALMGLKESYGFEEFIRIVWGEQDVFYVDDTVIPESREKLDGAAKVAKPHLGPARQRLRVRRPNVILSRSVDDSTGTLLTTDADDFERLRHGTDPDMKKDALRLVRGPIAEDVPLDAHQLEWFEERRQQQKREIQLLLESLFPRYRDYEGLVQDVLDHGGGAVLERDIGIALPPELPSFNELDWRLLGVTPAAIGVRLLPEPLPRPVDRLLDARLQQARDAQREGVTTTSHQRFVLVEGPSKVGKTRALYEAMRRSEGFNDMATLAPGANDPDDVAACLEIAARTGAEIILWLDDIDGYCSYQSETRGVSAGRLHRALTVNPQLVICATAGGRGAMRIAPRDRTSRLGHIWQEVLTETVEPVELSGGIDSADAPRARDAGWSEDVVSAIKRYGLGPALSAGPGLLARLKAARDGEDRYGWALACAVGLLEDAWLGSPVPERIARPAWRALVDERLQGSAEKKRWDEALAFVSARLGRAARLIESTKYGLTLNDYVRPRLEMRGEEVRRTLGGAAEALTLDECRAVLQASFGPLSLPLLSVALRLARAGDDEALLTIWEELKERPRPDDQPTAEAVIRLACHLARRITETSGTILNIEPIWGSSRDPMRGLVMMPPPRREIFCQHLERSSFPNADLLVSAVRLFAPNERAQALLLADDADRLVAAASDQAVDRSGLARALLERLPFHAVECLPESARDEIEDREECEYFEPLRQLDEIAADKLLSPVDLAIIADLIHDAVAKHGLDTVVCSLRDTVACQCAINAGKKWDNLDVIVPSLTRIMADADLVPQSRVMFSWAFLRLAYDSFDLEAEEALLPFTLDTDFEIWHPASKQLVRAYRDRADSDALYRFLERLVSPVAANSGHWKAPLQRRMHQLLLDHARQGDIEAALLICRLSGNRAGDEEAFVIAEQALELATPQKREEGADLLCSSFYDANYGQAGSEARRLGRRILAQIIRTSPVSVWQRTRMTQWRVDLLTAEDNHELDAIAALFDDVLQRGIDVTEEVRRLRRQLESERVEWLLHRWQKLRDDTLAPIWQWVSTLTPP